MASHTIDSLRERRLSLARTIDETGGITRGGGAADADAPGWVRAVAARVTLVSELLDHLAPFFADSFDYFDEGFLSDEPYLQRSHVFTPTAVLESLVRAAATDLEGIRAGWAQRGAGAGAFSQGGYTLYLADMLMQLALAPAVEHDLLPEREVFSHLGGARTLRPLPYAAVLLLGLSPDTHAPDAPKGEAAQISRDYLDLPLIAGHHVYRHAHLPGGTPRLRDRLRDRLRASGIGESAWQHDFVEPLVAALYATVAIGPVSALILQDRMAQHEGRRGRRGRRARAELLPPLVNETLRRLESQEGKPVLADLADQLDRRWVERQGGDPRRRRYRLRGAGRPKQGQVLLQALSPVIDQVIEALAPLLSDDLLFSFADEHGADASLESLIEGILDAELPSSILALGEHSILTEHSADRLLRPVRGRLAVDEWLDLAYYPDWSHAGIGESRPVAPPFPIEGVMGDAPSVAPDGDDEADDDGGNIGVMGDAPSSIDPATHTASAAPREPIKAVSPPPVEPVIAPMMGDAPSSAVSSDDSADEGADESGGDARTLSDMGDAPS